MMDMAQFRTKPVETWKDGDPSLLIQQVMKGDLNEIERDLGASIIRGDPPKRQRGPRIRSLKPVAAALVRFWRRDIDNWESKDAIIREIELRCEVSRTMAQKYLQQIDSPSTKAQAIQQMLFEQEKQCREVLLSSDDPEHLEIVAEQREQDLTPISEK